MVVKFLVSLIPVFLFLLMMLYLDSMKLVRGRLILYCLLWGVVSSILSYLTNTCLNKLFHLGIEDYAAYVAPVTEEILKFILLWIFIKRSKIGFMIDGAVYGFAIGAGFSFVENLFYLFLYAGDAGNLMDWIIRGFGTAIMHGGATAIMGIICMGAINRHSNLILATIFGGVASIIIHSSYNRLLVFPLLSTAFILLSTPVLIILIFKMNEKSIRNWLELEFDSEVNILRMIKKGMFSNTKTGSFLVSIKTHFPAEVVFDLYCFISLYLELSMKAKSLMMLNEIGIKTPKDASIQRKLLELKALKKNIGLGGYLAIAPVLKMTRKDLWKLSLLDNH